MAHVSDYTTLDSSRIIEHKTNILSVFVPDGNAWDGDPVLEGMIEGVRRPVSRVLSPILAERGMTIPLGRPSPDASRDLPGRRSGKTRRTSRHAAPIRSCSRWGLPCRRRCRRRGALLPHPFTLAARDPWRLRGGGLLSVALSLGSPPPGVTRRRLSVEPGLSSSARTARTARQRPSSRLTVRSYASPA